MASCTFMEIAKNYGVDYGDVLLAAEDHRLMALNIPVTYEVDVTFHAAQARIGHKAALAVALASGRRWGN